MTQLRAHPGAAELIDLAYYSTESGQSFAEHADAYAHFVAEGQNAGLNPSAYLYTDWYRWQNPDSAQYSSVLDHFFEKAATRQIDPAPFIDSVGLLRALPDVGTALDLYRMLLGKRLCKISPDIADHFARLDAARAAFHQRLDLRVLRDRGKQRPNLVWVQSGHAFKFAQWFDAGAPRDWDLLCNWYALPCLDLRFGDIVLRQSGTKMTGIHNVLTHMPDLLLRYDRVLFLDDDLIFKHRDIDLLFGLVQEHNLDLFQPSVAAGSNCVWPSLFQRPNSTVRLTTGVEIMMFGFSNRALKLCAPLFAKTVSGFGLDYACSAAVRAQGWRCGVLDAVPAQHLDKIDQSGGSYYQFMRSIGINQKLELYETLACSGGRPKFAPLACEDGA